LIWMSVVFGLLAAVLAAATDLSLVGTMAFVGVCVAVVAAVVTVVVIWSGAYGSPRDRGDGPRRRMGVGGRWGAKAAFRAQRCAAQAGS
jgi:hypothetical protein